MNKIVPTSAITSGHFAMGMAYAGLGPTLPTLAYNLNTDLKETSWLVFSRGIGSLFGSLISGMAYKKMSPHLYLSVSMLVTAIGLALVPYLPSVTALSIVFAVKGMTLGALDTMGNVLLLDFWQGRSGSYFQLIKFTYSLGGSFAPLIASPFILPLDSINAPANITSHETKEEGMSVKWAFLIYAIVIACVSLFFLAIGLAQRCSAVTSTRQITKVEERSSFRLKILILLFLFFLLYIGMIDSMGTYLFSFATSKQMGLNKTQGVLLSTVFLVCVAGGRLLGIFTANRITSTHSLVINLIGVICSASLMLLHTTCFPTKLWMLWIGVGVFGVAISVLYGSCFVFTEEHITVTSGAATVMVIGGAVGEMTIPFAIGNLVERNPACLVYAAFAFAIVETLIFYVIYIMISRRQSKKSGNKSCNKDETKELNT